MISERDPINCIACYNRSFAGNLHIFSDFLTVLANKVDQMSEQALSARLQSLEESVELYMRSQRTVGIRRALRMRHQSLQP